MGNLLDVKELVTAFQSDNGKVVPVDHIDFHIGKGETLGIVGESGCGKSVTSLSIMGLLGKNGKVENGQIIFNDSDLTKISNEEYRGLRGKEMSMIFQEPMTSLNPVFTIVNQLIEGLKIHLNFNKRQAKEHAISMLKKVGIPRAEEVMENYPYQLSGGMRQRVMIAMALSCMPKLLIADEPTTALDVTIQSQILNLMKSLIKESDTAIMLITHDLGVIAEMADRVIVMYAGQIVEEADVYALFDHPKHPYTKGLMDSIPHIDFNPDERLNSIKGNVPSVEE